MTYEPIKYYSININMKLYCCFCIRSMDKYARLMQKLEIVNVEFFKVGSSVDACFCLQNASRCLHIYLDVHGLACLGLFK